MSPSPCLDRLDKQKFGWVFWASACQPTTGLEPPPGDKMALSLPTNCTRGTGPRAALAIITCRLSRVLLRLYCSRAFIFSPWFFCKQQNNLKHGLHGLLQGVNFSQLSSFTRDVCTTVWKQNFSYTFWFPQNAEPERVSPYKEHQSTECDTLNSAPKANKEKTFHSFICPTKFFGEKRTFSTPMRLRAFVCCWVWCTLLAG